MLLNQYITIGPSSQQKRQKVDNINIDQYVENIDSVGR